VNNSAFAVYLATISGLIGYLLVKLECEPTPFVLGFILGPMLEENLRRAMIMSDGDVSVFLTGPISAVLLLIAAVMLIVVCVPSIAKRREAVFVEE
jgi:TctA family transporter